MLSRDHLRLQFIILLWGFTAVLGALITLPAAEIVVFRTAMASILLLIILRKRVHIPLPLAASFFATGFIIGLHWVTFFLAVKVANVSICMVGLATISIWTAILEPIMVRERHFRPIDLFFGLIVAGGVAIIFRSELSYSHGFLIALLSALLVAIFSVINSHHVKRAHHQVITFYEMAGACFSSLLYLLLSVNFFTDGGQVHLSPTGLDILYLVILSSICTVYTFVQYVELLNRLSVFTITFSTNLEPIYGIVLAALILKDYQNLHSGFYLGALIILVAISLYPFVRKRFVS